MWLVAPFRTRLFLFLAVLVPLVAIMGCDDDPTGPDPSVATFRVEACTTQSFAIRLSDPLQIQLARSLMVHFAEVATQACDGCPRMVEQDLDYWIGTVGRFCPWTARTVERID
jgi:hypothetical protein